MASPTYSLKNLKIWNGVDDVIDAGVDAITVNQGVLEYVGSSDQLNQVETKDMSGLTLIPGLIDGHIHLCLNPDIGDPFQQDRVSSTELAQQMAERAKAMLGAGITTARDLGGGKWLEIELRDRIQQEELMGPRLICSGQPITSIKGHCHFWGGEAESTEDVMEVLHRQLEHKVDLIKVMATGGNLTPGSNPMDAQFSAEILSSIVKRAEAEQMQVAAHCHGTSGIRNAVSAGVSTIEHCSWVGKGGWGRDFDPDVTTNIVSQGIWVSPTINTEWKRHFSEVDHERAVMENFAEMKKKGVRLIASTDAGIPNVWHHDLPKALPLFAHFTGSTPIQTLRAATSNCAEAIGLGGVTGKIIEGLSADFLLFDGNPTENLDHLQNMISVYKHGKDFSSLIPQSS